MLPVGDVVFPLGGAACTSAHVRALLNEFVKLRPLHNSKTPSSGSRESGDVRVKFSVCERELLDMLRLDGMLTAVRIAQTYSISTRQAERLLISFKKKNLIRRVGPDKGGHWEVVP